MSNSRLLSLFSVALLLSCAGNTLFAMSDEEIDGGSGKNDNIKKSVSVDDLNVPTPVNSDKGKDYSSSSSSSSSESLLDHNADDIYNLLLEVKEKGDNNYKALNKALKAQHSKTRNTVNTNHEITRRNETRHHQDTHTKMNKHVKKLSEDSDSGSSSSESEDRKRKTNRRKKGKTIKSHSSHSNDEDSIQGLDDIPFIRAQQRQTNFNVATATWAVAKASNFAFTTLLVEADDDPNDNPFIRALGDIEKGTRFFLR